jgi:phage replication initiation protein
MITLNGSGCMAAKDGWEMRVFNFLKLKAVAPKITRVDLAHDVYDGVNYSLDRAFADYKTDLYTNGGRTPDCEQRGNWERPSGKGRTFYVGHRTNGKFARIYEKGKQLGDKESPWVRCEVEFKSVDRIVPFDVLLCPGQYLAEAYPAFNWISEKRERIETKKKEAQAGYSKMVEWLHRQCGAAIWAMSVIEGSAENALSKVVRVGKVPACLSVPDFNCSAEFIHHKEKFRERLPLAMVVGEADSPLLHPPYSAAF